MRTVLALALALLSGCLEYDFRDKDKVSSGDSWDTGFWGGDDSGGPDPDRTCPSWSFDVEDCGLSDSCNFGDGTFTPIVEWELGEGLNSRATVAVGDVDLDGMPEIIASVTSLFGNGTLIVAHGDGSGTLWEVEADIGYAAAPALADLDDDGSPEIVVVREYANSMLGTGDYTMVAYSADGDEIWESEHFVGDDFDYAAAISVSDMDHDGSPEINAGRVILNADGSTRGIGEYGRGSMGQVAFGELTLDEASIAAVADLDLDGVEEVITGNAMYSPDGETLWYDASENDGMVGVANLDDDEQGEFVAVTGNTVRAVDTDGSILWGPETLTTANIVSPPAIDDIDLDGEPEIIVAGGNKLVVYNRDGSILWTARVTDLSGASGASIFDFEGDGQPEVVYIDEVEMAAYDGATGALKFYSTKHASDTMYDYPVIADVDGDSQAEIVVAHVLYDSALSVYGDEDESWAPARPVWNQHGYSITNINDDLSVPETAVPNFTTYNSWHSALDRAPGTELVMDLESEILGVCEDDCEAGVLYVAGRIRNRSEEALPAGTQVALYAIVGGEKLLASVKATREETPSGKTSEVLEFEVSADTARETDALWLEADDDGTGTGAVAECDDDNNAVTESGPFCD